MKKTMMWLSAVFCIGLCMIGSGAFSADEYCTSQSLVRMYRLAPPPVGAAIDYEDLDNDGDPDVLRTVTVNDIPVQWIDDDDDMKKDDWCGDMDSDCLMVDRNKDGKYGSFGDLMVDWNDEDGDGKADMQVIAENAKPTNAGMGPGHFMIVIDTDGDNVFNYVDWKTMSLKCWDHSGHCNFYTDYLGKSLFIKMHSSTYTFKDLRYNWENPFLFYDPDNDGQSEMAVRIIDNPIVTKDLPKDFAYPEDGKIADENRTLGFSKNVTHVSVAYDLDNDNGPGNELDFDVALRYLGPGFPYDDQVHKFKGMRGLPAADKFFYDPRWRQMTELIYPDHEAALDLTYNRGKWTSVLFTFDEDDDCNRWERVELYEPRDMFKIGNREGGIDNNPQSDMTGDRGEWDEDFSSGGKFYVGRFDGRIHLLGAEWGAWRIDQDALYFQGMTKSKEKPEMFPTIKYSDTNNNGFIDTIEYDMDGDMSFERKASLLEMGIDDRCEVIDHSKMSYEQVGEMYKKNADAQWKNAQDAVRIAKKYGLDLTCYAFIMKPKSIREKDHFGYWLASYIHQDLRYVAQRRNDNGLLSKVDKAYYSGDWKLLD